MSKIQRIKTHIHTHKAIYITGGVCLAAVVGAYAGYRVGVRHIRDIEQQINTDTTQVNVIAWKPKQNVEVYVEALGDPGNIIQDTTTGIVYASQGQAARELGLKAPDISRHLNGHTTNVDGHIFENLGKAMVADAA